MIQGRAIEFFSGMGSFAEACRSSEIEVVAAFDQNTFANSVYEHNFNLRPVDSTLDSIRTSQIPDAEIWWMSPPCTPYSVRGKRDDLKDPRAKSLMRLMQIVRQKLPRIVILENVRGFANSQAKELVFSTLIDLGYQLKELLLCSTDFGTPMRRPRYFMIAVLPVKGEIVSFEDFKITDNKISPNLLRTYLDESFDSTLIMDDEEFRRWEPVLNIVSPNDDGAISICFTKNYYRCKTASGSLLQISDGRVRRFSSREMLRIFGFSSAYNIPATVTEQKAAGLIGNAVDIRAISYLLKTVVAPFLRKPPRFDLIGYKNSDSALSY